MINFRRTFAWPFRSIRARHGHPPPLARDNRNALGLNRVPVAIVDVGAVETLDHLGGACAGFDGLEDAECNEVATVCIVQAIHIDDEGDVREGLGEVEGVHTDLPDVVPPADVEGRGSRLPRGAGVDVFKLEGDVADASTPVGDAELAGARGDVFAILAAHVRDARANLRLRSIAAPTLRHLYRVHVLAFSFICLWVAEQDTAGIMSAARAK